jgi:hypothetical protein
MPKISLAEYWAKWWVKDFMKTNANSGSEAIQSIMT